MEATYWDVLTLTENERISFKDACIKYNLSYKGFYYFRKKHNIPCVKRGHHVNSSRFIRRKYNLNDSFFSHENLTIDSCYWAGFIAADGNIAKNKKQITISLQHDDKTHLIKFKKLI